MHIFVVTKSHFWDHKSSLPLFALLLLHCSFGRFCSFLPIGHLLVHSCFHNTLHPQSFLKRHIRLIWKRMQHTTELNSFSRHFPPPNSTKRDVLEPETVTWTQWWPIQLHGRKKPPLPNMPLLLSSLSKTCNSISKLLPGTKSGMSSVLGYTLGSPLSPNSFTLTDWSCRVAFKWASSHLWHHKASQKAQENPMACWVCL